VHDLLGVHFFEALKNAVDDCPGLIGFEFVFGLYLVIELSSFKQLNNNVKGVLRLEDFK